MLFKIPKFPVLFNDVEEDRFCRRDASRVLVDIFLIQPVVIWSISKTIVAHALIRD